MHHHYKSHLGGWKMIPVKSTAIFCIRHQKMVNCVHSFINSASKINGEMRRNEFFHTSTILTLLHVFCAVRINANMKTLNKMKIHFYRTMNSTFTTDISSNYVITGSAHLPSHFKDNTNIIHYTYRQDLSKERLFIKFSST